MHFLHPHLSQEWVLNMLHDFQWATLSLMKKHQLPCQSLLSHMKDLSWSNVYLYNILKGKSNLCLIPEEIKFPLLLSDNCGQLYLTHKNFWANSRHLSLSLCLSESMGLVILVVMKVCFQDFWSQLNLCKWFNNILWADKRTRRTGPWLDHYLYR